MADIADAKANINDVEVDADAALSEALFEKIGGAINYLNTTTDDHETRLTVVEAGPPTEKSTGTGGFSTLSLSYVDVTNLDDSITPTLGTRVLIMLQPDGTGPNTRVFQNAGDNGTLRLLRGGVEIASWQFTTSMIVPSSSIAFIDTSATQNSANNYKFQAKVNAGTASFEVEQDVQMVLAEIP